MIGLPFSFETENMNNNSRLSTIGSGFVWAWTCCVCIVLRKIPLSNQENETPPGIRLELE